MRILIESVGSYGDIFPFIAIGRDLRRRGHDVRFIANAHFEPLARAAELTFVASGDAASYDAFTRHPDSWHPRKGFGRLMAMLTSHAGDALRLLSGHTLPGETLVVGSTLAFGSRLLQETHHIPGVTVHLAPSIFRSVHRPPKLPRLFMPDWLPLSLKHLLWRVGDERYIDPLLAGPLNTIRAEYGLPPTSRFFDAWIHAPDRVVGLFPDWFGDPQPDWPEQVRCTGFPLYDRVNDERLADEVIRFLEAGEPPVVFTAGTAMRRGRDFYAAAVDACWRLNGRGILLTRYPEQIPTPLPDTVRHFTYVPLSLLLPHAAVIVHHAGIGTSSQALRAGVPQLLRPMAYDQFDNAHRLEQLGVGLIIDRRRSTGSRMAGKLHILINQLSYREAAQRIADRFTGQDPIAESCDLIEETRD